MTNWVRTPEKDNSFEHCGRPAEWFEDEVYCTKCQEKMSTKRFLVPFHITEFGYYSFDALDLADAINLVTQAENGELDSDDLPDSVRIIRSTDFMFTDAPREVE